MATEPSKDEAAKKARAESLRSEIRNIEAGKTPDPKRPLSPREITDAAARKAAKGEKPA